jgi:hypothetical protein
MQVAVGEPPRILFILVDKAVTAFGHGCRPFFVVEEQLGKSRLGARARLWEQGSMGRHHCGWVGPGFARLSGIARASGTHVMAGTKPFCDWFAVAFCDLAHGAIYLTELLPVYKNYVKWTKPDWASPQLEQDAVRARERMTSKLTKQYVEDMRCTHIPNHMDTIDYAVEQGCISKEKGDRMIRTLKGWDTRFEEKEFVFEVREWLTNRNLPETLENVLKAVRKLRGR